jgi:predicted nucleotidyltransferase component of viral defense system
MLHLKTVNKGTFTLLKSLASQDKLQEFSLAGGTALALQFGHRVSMDLDFFTKSPFDSNELFEYLRDSYDVSYCSQSANSLSLFIKLQGEDIKVDFIRHNYPLLRPIRVIDKVRIFSLEDIAAMKLNAIANRGAKKDFYDIHALLNCFSLQDLLEFFEQKYEQMNSFTVVKSLVYFADADLEPEPVSLVDVTWDDIKENFKNQMQTIFS